MNILYLSLVLYLVSVVISSGSKNVFLGTIETTQPSFQLSGATVPADPVLECGVSMGVVVGLRALFENEKIVNLQLICRLLPSLFRIHEILSEPYVPITHSMNWTSKQCREDFVLHTMNVYSNDNAITGLGLECQSPNTLSNTNGLKEEVALGFMEVNKGRYGCDKSYTLTGINLGAAAVIEDPLTFGSMAYVCRAVLIFSVCVTECDGQFQLSECTEFQDRTCTPCNCTHQGSTENNCSIETGFCNSCEPHYTGNYCTACAPDNSYKVDNLCYYCDCFELGSINSSCDATGRCNCKDNRFRGLKCNLCTSITRNDENCTLCNCNMLGSISASCRLDGQCECKPNYTGPTCDSCREGYLIDSNNDCVKCSDDSIPKKLPCSPCSCLLDYSTNSSCQENGQCYCSTNYTGLRCDKCTNGRILPNCQTFASNASRKEHESSNSIIPFIIGGTAGAIVFISSGALLYKNFHGKKKDVHVKSESREVERHTSTSSTAAGSFYVDSNRASDGVYAEICTTSNNLISKDSVYDNVEHFESSVCNSEIETYATLNLKDATRFEEPSNMRPQSATLYTNVYK